MNIITKRWYQVPIEITATEEFKNLDLSVKCFYFVLCKLASAFADEHGWFYHGLNKLIKETRMDKKTIGRAKKILLKLGYIEVNNTYFETGSRGSDKYKIKGFKFNDFKEG